MANLALSVATKFIFDPLPSIFTPVNTGFTFFILAAKQAVREQALPFQTRMINGNYNIRAYQLAMNNTKYNNEGIAIVDKDNEWRNETEWDDMFDQMKMEMKAK